MSIIACHRLHTYTTLRGCFLWIALNSPSVSARYPKLWCRRPPHQSECIDFETGIRNGELRPGVSDSCWGILQGNSVKRKWRSYMGCPVDLLWSRKRGMCMYTAGLSYVCLKNYSIHVSKVFFNMLLSHNLCTYASILRWSAFANNFDWPHNIGTQLYVMMYTHEYCNIYMYNNLQTL